MPPALIFDVDLEAIGQLRNAIGPVDVRDFGPLMIAHDRSTDMLHLHGVAHLKAEVDRDLQQAIVATSAAFSAAFLAEERNAQKAIIGTIIREVLHRDAKLSDRIKQIKFNECYD